MPSPIAHTAAAYLVYRLTPGARAVIRHQRFARWPLTFAVFAGFSLLPDLDSLPGLIVGDLGRSHNTSMHSLIGGVFLAVVVGLCLVILRNEDYLKWSLVALMCYELHVIMDFFTIGRGVMLLWPLSPTRFSSPIPVFFGLRWSEGWISLSHVWTLVNEAVFSLVILLALRGKYLWKARRFSGSSEPRSADRRGNGVGGIEPVVGRRVRSDNTPSD